MNRQQAPNEETLNRIRQHLQQPDARRRINQLMHDAHMKITVTTSRAAQLFGFGEQQLRDWDKRGLIKTERFSTLFSDDGKQSIGHRQFTLDELDKLAIIRELIDKGGFTPGDLQPYIDLIWHEISSAELPKIEPGEEEAAFETELPIDQHLNHSRAKLFWRFYASHALRLSLMLIGEDLPGESIGLLLPLKLEPAQLSITQIEHIRLLGESLVGWLGHSRSTHTLLTRKPCFTFDSDFRIHPLQVMRNNIPETDLQQDQTHIIIRREARAITLEPEVVETIRALLKPLYEEVEQVRTCFGSGMNDVLESSPILDSSARYPDLILDSMADMIVRIGGQENQKPRWLFCCILLPKDPSRPLQQRTLVVRAQSVKSPHKVGVASVSPTAELSSLSLRAYQSGRMCFRDKVIPEDSVIAFRDVEHDINSAIALPIGAEDGEPVAVIYVASEFESAFSMEQDRCLLRLLGRMVGEVIRTYQVRRLEVEKLENIIHRPDVVDEVVGELYSENDFINELEAFLLSFKAERQQSKQSSSLTASTFAIGSQQQGVVQSKEYVIALIGIDVDHLSSHAAKYGTNAMRNLNREIGLRIKAELASTFGMYPKSKFYHIYADRFFVLLKNISHDQLIAKAKLLKKSLDGTYKVSLLSTQLPPPIHLEEIKITVRLAVSGYESATLERLLEQSLDESGVYSTRETIEHSLSTELKKGMSEGGNRIRAWNPETHLYELLVEVN